MSIKTILNRCHPIRYFVYGAARFVGEQIHVVVRPRAGSLCHCGECGGRGPTYDTARHPRLFEFVPLWGYVVFLVYRMRRIDCSTCGVRTEQVPWADGKNRCCNVYRLFLARWSRRVSWSEVALIFGVTWGVVNRATRWVVEYGLVHRDLDRVTAIGVDEIAVWKGHKYLTVVYQIDQAPPVVDPALPMIAWLVDDDESDGDGAPPLPSHPVALTSPQVCLAPPAVGAPISVQQRAVTDRSIIAAPTSRGPPGTTRRSTVVGAFVLAALPVLGEGLL